VEGVVRVKLWGIVIGYLAYDDKYNMDEALKLTVLKNMRNIEV
jgi:hypothetical protein